MVKQQTPSVVHVTTLIRHLPNLIKLYWRLFLDHRVPLLPKVLLLAALVYVVVPFDFDMIPVVGQIDDLVVAALACRWFIRLCPPAVVQEHVACLDRGR